MKQLVNVMMQLIKSEVCGTPMGEISNEVFSDFFLENLYQISKAHDLAHIVGSALEKLGVLKDEDDPISEQFRKQGFTAVYRYQQLQYAYETVCEVLESEKIPYMPLKGSVIRPYYAEPWMRTSCDIDILVHEENLEKAVETLCGSLEFTAEDEKQYHDISLYSQNGIHLELHFSILENMDNIDALLSKVWEHAVLTDGSTCSYRQTNEYLLFHVLAHMSYHFIRGGCGIRPLIDLYLLKNKMPFDDTAVRALCAQCGIERFYDSVLALSEVWFANAEHTAVTREMEQYLLCGGIYGTQENQIAVEHEKRGGKLRYILHRLFMPYSNLKSQYPILEKHKWLMPVCQVRRWFRMLFRGRLKRSVAELKMSQNMDAKKAKATAELLREIGL